jgi:hypothetical protein
VTPSDPDLGGIDLPSSPDLAIEHRRLAAPIGGCFGARDEPLGLDGLDWKGDPARAVDIDRWHENLSSPADAKVTRTLDGTKAVEQRGTDRRHGSSRQAGSADDRQVDVLGLQEIMRRERTHKKSRSCVTSVASLIANPLAALHREKRRRGRVMAGPRRQSNRNDVDD